MYSECVLLGCICNLFCVVNNMLDEGMKTSYEESAFVTLFEFLTFHVVSIVNCVASALRIFSVS